MMDITIEGASVHDLDELYQIEKECFSEEAFTKQQIAYLLQDYDTISLIARENGTIVGVIMGSIHLEHCSPIGHILTIDVASGNRRKGIGTQLLKAIEKILRQKGVRKCSLEVREDNDAALRLYENSGYTQAGKLRKYYGNRNGYLLVKKL